MSFCPKPRFGIADPIGVIVSVSSV